MTVFSRPPYMPTSACGEVRAAVEASPRRSRPQCAGRGRQSGSGPLDHALGPTCAGKWNETRPSGRPLLTGPDPQDRPVAEPLAPRAAETHRSACPAARLPACRWQAEDRWPRDEVCGDGAWTLSDVAPASPSALGRRVLLLVRLFASRQIDNLCSTLCGDRFQFHSADASLVDSQILTLRSYDGEAGSPCSRSDVASFSNKDLAHRILLC
jgi:hypothetical protein